MLPPAAMPANLEHVSGMKLWDPLASETATDRHDLRRSTAVVPAASVMSRAKAGVPLCGYHQGNEAQGEEAASGFRTAEIDGVTYAL